MRSILALTFKDLRLLWRDRFGLFWVVAFPLIMALFFGSIFSGAGGKARTMEVALVNDNSSEAARAFYGELASSSAIEAVYLRYDSARHLVSRGNLTAYVYLRDTVISMAAMFGGGGKTTIEVGVDPSRQAEKGYLQGLVSQAYYGQVQQQMMNPDRWMTSLDQGLQTADTVSGLSAPQREVLTGFLSNLKDFLSSVDSAGVDSARVAEAMPQPNLEIDFADVATERVGPNAPAAPICGCVWRRSDISTFSPAKGWLVSLPRSQYAARCWRSG